jgi:hypothetical protein
MSVRGAVQAGIKVGKAQLALFAAPPPSIA